MHASKARKAAPLAALELVPASFPGETGSTGINPTVLEGQEFGLC